MNRIWNIRNIKGVGDEGGEKIKEHYWKVCQGEKKKMNRIWNIKNIKGFGGGKGGINKITVMEN